MPQPPHILWILTTQWRAQACGYAGDPNACTPHLDALAAASVDYTQAVTPHPFGPFARAALLTGVPSPENGVCDYYDPLPLDRRTLAHELRERGYETAFFGKWHLAARDPHAPLVGEAHARMIVPAAARGGFEFWEGFESGFQLNDPWLHGTRLPEPTCFPGYQADVLVERALRWNREQTPFPGARSSFTVVSLESPHPPYQAASAGLVPQRRENLELRANVPRGTEIEAKAREELVGYYAHIAATDRAIGRLVAQIAADTQIVFTSVHGDMHGSHGLFRKGWPHEESVRVPLLVRRPGIGPRRDPTSISLLDVMRAQLAWIDGDSTPPRTEFSDLSMPSVVKLPWQADRVWRGIRSPRRKLILNQDGSPWLFFDLERDPGESTNLVSEPACQAEMTRLRSQVKS